MTDSPGLLLPHRRTADNRAPRGIAAASAHLMRLENYRQNHMTEPLTAAEAAEQYGIPAAQLKRWAAQKAVGFQAGPKFVGSWLHPKYRAEDLDEWMAEAKRFDRIYA